MNITFYKYEGAGNDFVMIDNRNIRSSFTIRQIAKLCDRHFGIGADGLILLENDKEHDFYMRYFNADGREATLCGNGGRCAVAFARKLELIERETVFRAADGVHTAHILAYEQTAIVKLQMHDVDHWNKHGEDLVIDTGSPHYVKFVDNCGITDVTALGREIRNSEPFRNDGINVDFVSDHGTFLEMRTYERGVESETLACGTGAVASALAYALRGKNPPVKINALGGSLTVDFQFVNNRFTDISLTGPATFVFRGIINIR